MRGPTPVQLAAPETIRVAVVASASAAKWPTQSTSSTGTEELDKAPANERVVIQDVLDRLQAARLGPANTVRHVTGMPMADVVILGSQSGHRRAS